MMQGWVIYNGHLPSSKFLSYAEWIKEAATKKNIKINVVKNNAMLSMIDSQGSHLLKQAHEAQPDFVLFLDKDIALAKQLEQLGIPVFNSSKCIDICDNKITTYQHLAKHKLPIPKTIIAPKIFPGVKEIDTTSYLAIERELEYPMVVKEAYGSFGEQVYLIHSRQALFALIQALEDRPFVIQEYISSSYGRDIRLNVVGDQVVASMIRTAKNDFRANVAVGGTTEAYQPTEQEISLALAAAKAVEASFAGVDLLFGPNSQPIICEVNSNAHIQGTYQSTGINVADYMIDYIVRTLD
ncbi:RimK family alpha-L-glutamate ligase [Aquibacillus koreensis]|uniref:RimK family alpha-L-glutamate ligase n=1 Tax=Aquibacillus koreensis TaxID=279446 RepID=A0A9X4AGQ5_9BACI|nr:RimK family alpha-L-glutamate ligase [Aquibacillus koreensis]MCT2537938.1 RimK family alpha-L-glutamate ligase [Aquibacillus koreensis]MDC3419171.1 RimK family alpha-L-glutamate ligase [Aquibacillus koreensis]